MGDLEMTRLCAEAMGYTDIWVVTSGNPQFVSCKQKGEYQPLKDDAQAMALVKKFRLHIEESSMWDATNKTDVAAWFVRTPRDTQEFWGESVDLNRAIVQCVAKRQEP